MKKHPILFATVSCLLILGTANAFAGHQIGAGIHYLSTVGDIKDEPEIDDSNFNFVAGYKWKAPLLSFQADVEFVPDYLGSDEMLYQPQAFVLLGGLIYGGAGIGMGYVDGEWFDNPFYALRAGVDLPLGGLHLDVNANYRFLSSKVDGIDDEDINMDSITFGAMLRISL